MPNTPRLRPPAYSRSAGLLAALAVLLQTATALCDSPIPCHGIFHSKLIDDGNDLIFPSVIRAADHFDDPLGTWYLYTSPHRGADIRLYFADAVTGPWMLHGTVVDEAVGQADHVSSPHAAWNEDAEALFLYVHAPNSQTIYCTSSDGVHFQYGGVCVTSEMLSPIVGFESRSASYARVHRHQLPEYGSTWTMTLTASGREDERGLKPNAIVLCTSNDGISWTPQRTLLDDPEGGRTYKTLDACWLPWQGRDYMVYARRSRADEGRDPTQPVRLYLSEGDENWRDWKTGGVFYDPARQPPDNWCARGVSFLEVDGTPYVVYEAGDKNAARIALLQVSAGAPGGEADRAESPSAPATSLDAVLEGRRLRTVYETSFDEPLRVVRESELVEDGKYVREPAEGIDWIFEGPGSVRVADGRLHMECADGHSVLWNRRTFPSDFVAEWDFQPHHRQGLAILFFAANARTGGHIHQSGLPAREGVFRNYTKGEIDCYHTSYFAVSKEGVPRGETHVRKNHGSHLVAEGPSPLDGADRKPHRIRVAKIGPRILLEVDGEVSIDWTDPGEAGESKRAPYASGQIGLRQMSHAIEGSYGNFKVQSIE